MQIVLASQSPRRRELLRLLGIRDFAVLPARTEAEPDLSLAPGPALEQVALSKALDVQRGLTAEAQEDSLIIGADTMVFLEGRLLGKPRDLEEAGQMLQALSGKVHQVYTALALCQGERRQSDSVKTDVYFRGLTAAATGAYLRREQVLDKAGAYAIQGLAAGFIEKIDGDYFNVVGLPLCRLTGMLRDFGFDVFGEDIG